MIEEDEFLREIDSFMDYLRMKYNMDNSDIAYLRKLIEAYGKMLTWRRVRTVWE